MDGIELGCKLGTPLIVGADDGSNEGWPLSVGELLGRRLGSSDGEWDGSKLGSLDGECDGERLGCALGSELMLLCEGMHKCNKK